MKATSTKSQIRNPYSADAALTILRHNYQIAATKILPLHLTEDRHTYKILGSGGNYVLKITKLANGINEARRDTGIYSFLDLHKYKAPQIVRTSHGTNFVDLGLSNFAYVQTFVEGTTPVSSEENYFLLGEAMGRLHALPLWYRKSETVIEIMHRILRKGTQWSMPQSYFECLGTIGSFEALPEAVIHTDVKLDNSVLLPSSEIVLVDWDGAGTGTRILDNGQLPLMGFIGKETYRIDSHYLKAFYQGYKSKISLTPHEIESLFDASMLYMLDHCIYGRGPQWQEFDRALWVCKNRTAVEDQIIKNFS